MARRNACKESATGDGDARIQLVHAAMYLTGVRGALGIAGPVSLCDEVPRERALWSRREGTRRTEAQKRQLIASEAKRNFEEESVGKVVLGKSPSGGDSKATLGSARSKEELAPL